MSEIEVWRGLTIPNDHPQIERVAREHGYSGPCCVSHVRLCRTCQLGVLTAAAREEGRREQQEAHAAQLVALRDIVDCACNALTDSIRASGNDARTNMHWVDMLRRKALAPLPGAEAALARVKEEAVRDAVNGLSDRDVWGFATGAPHHVISGIPRYCAQFRADLLNALGVKP